MRRKMLLAMGSIVIASLIIVSSAVIATIPVTNNEMTDRPTNLATNEGDDLRSLSTQFNSPESLQNWQEHQVEGWTPKWETPKIEHNSLVLQPRSSGWFEDNQAGHLYREVAGDFIVTTRIRVEGTQTSIPQRSFSLAGLLIREPQIFTKASWTPKKENWLFFSIGTAFPAGNSQFEMKSTTNSLSTLKIADAPEGWMRLRVARSGELFTLLYQAENSDQWQVLDQFIRPDLSETLNVGLTAYADWDSIAADYPNYQLIISLIFKTRFTTNAKRQ